MRCWHCDTELIWGGDHDCAEDTEDYQMETNFSCPNCGSFYLAYYSKQKEKKEEWLEGYKKWRKEQDEPE